VASSHKESAEVGTPMVRRLCVFRMNPGSHLHHVSRNLNSGVLKGCCSTFLSGLLLWLHSAGRHSYHLRANPHQRHPPCSVWRKMLHDAPASRALMTATNFLARVDRLQSSQHPFWDRHRSVPMRSRRAGRPAIFHTTPKLRHNYESTPLTGASPFS
jgi:hypothetical protein